VVLGFVPGKDLVQALLDFARRLFLGRCPFLQGSGQARRLILGVAFEHIMLDGVSLKGGDYTNDDLLQVGTAVPRVFD
jgi:hypothetical protein